MRFSDIRNVETPLSSDKRYNTKIIWLLAIGGFFILVIWDFIAMNLPGVEFRVKYAISLPFRCINMAMVIAALIISSKSKKRTDNISMWLKDAVEVEATITKLSDGKKSRLEVVFELDEVMHKNLSKPYTGRSIFVKYEDKKQTVYYSPTYDQVLLLK